MPYILSAEAEDDVDTMYFDGALRRGRRAARDYIDRLKDTLDLLSANPPIGTVRGGSRKTARIHPFGAHVILYREVRGGIIVLGIRPQRENWVRFVF
jgi:toxin ParE1/3/4